MNADKKDCCWNFGFGGLPVRAAVDDLIKEEQLS